MCGRFTNAAKKDEIRKEFKVGKKNPDIYQARYNIAPSQMIEVILERKGGRVLEQLKWGLVPHWAKDDLIGNKLINARAETLAEKPSFREAFKSRRCIIPASGFYEWKKAKDGKQPYYFYLKEKEIFGFAGLWESWLDKRTGEELETCVIITTEANAVLKSVHDRMPVILKSENYDEWLDAKEKDIGKLQKLLASFPAEKMDSHAVGKSVNVPGADSEELIKKLNSL